jgi:aminoglycoside phosphotransferase (APT) family kinase protein
MNPVGSAAEIEPIVASARFDESALEECKPFPTRDEALRLYCQLTGRKQVPHLNWHFAFNMFRLVGILQGVRKRLRDGNATGEHAAEMAARTPGYAQIAWQYALRAGA